MPLRLGVIAAACVVSLINVPFGFWRAGVRKLSPPWFAAVHVPVALAIAFRLAIGLPLRLATLPLFVGAFIAGQSLGGRLHSVRGAGRSSGNPDRSGT